MVEARALPSLGMPTGAFTLIFDGDPIPEKSSEVFRVVRHHAIRQLLVEHTHEEMHQVNIPSYAERQESPEYVFEGFLEVVGEMVRGEGFTKCNFSTGGSWVALSGEESIDSKTRLTSMLEAKSLPETFETSWPLPPWTILVGKNVATKLN
jgi:hypothetical protein